MCGIVGYVGHREALRVLLDSLKRLEYRGYDSAGVAIAGGQAILCEKAPGKIAQLEARIDGRPLGGTTGLGHTRWATHGGVTETNAHPHLSCDGRIAVVHNGIIENYEELRNKFPGHRFRSSTDTEVIPHLIEHFYADGAQGDPLQAVRRALELLHGSFAIGVLFVEHPGLLVAARVNCPLVVGLGDGESFLASDISALLPYTRRVVPLGEGEIAKLDGSGLEVYSEDLSPRDHRLLEITWEATDSHKGDYPHYMLKEIYEQGSTIAAELRGREESLDGIDPMREVERLVIVACGTAWHAALVGKMAIEELARVPVDVWMGSELRYADYPFQPGTLTVAISQSGETADTLAAARKAREEGSRILAVTNARGSTLAREADQVVYMRSGPERGVAATKTYTSQLVCMILLALHVARNRGAISDKRFGDLWARAAELPEAVETILEDPSEILRAALTYGRDHRFMYIGRRYNLATAYEGALKMKEISYLHAEAFGAGEMKHGPLALVDETMAGVAVAPAGRVTDKMVSNIQEVRARNGAVISVATRGDSLVRSVSDVVLDIPPCEEIFSPILAVIPLQLLAYYTARELGREVDQPRNLAKSVTVE
jgi:glucosamine--fructose-6-phosphate aminotransferase (isomerizing)